MESCDTGENRTFLIPTRRRKNGQAVNLDTVVERVCHAGRKRWTMRREKTPDPFSLSQADQLSGRVVAVSNAAVFNDPVFNDTQRALICYMR
jgi:hypothetical protein